MDKWTSASGFDIISRERPSQGFTENVSIDRSLNRRPTTVDVKTGKVGKMGAIGNWPAQPSMTIRNACVCVPRMKRFDRYSGGFGPEFGPPEPV